MRTGNDHRLAARDELTDGGDDQVDRAASDRDLPGINLSPVRNRLDQVAFLGARVAVEPIELGEKRLLRSGRGPERVLVRSELDHSLDVEPPLELFSRHPGDVAHL